MANIRSLVSLKYRSIERLMKRICLFYGWLATFFTTWLILVVFGERWPTVVAHWPIALSMAFGSYIAGSTPMGGGTVGFPVLVLFFDLPGSLGRNFALSVQSIGMVSASIFIVSTRQPLEWRILRPAMLGSLLGTPFGALFVAPVFPDLWVKLVFAVVWCSFGVMHLVKLKELIDHQGENERLTPWFTQIGLIVGVTGGIVSSVTGVGIDMMLYAIMVLLFQADLKIAIPTSVLIMAFTSVVGIATNAILARVWPEKFQIDPEVFANWLAAAPVVACGAPLGAYVVERISRKPTLIIVSALCIGQYVWTLFSEQVTGVPLLCAIAAVLLVNGIFHLLYTWGRRS
ncbi:MAG: sulfite exporter TauE/SafE family protein [Pirellulaceae bacterium]